MDNYNAIWAVLITIAILASFYAGSIGFGFRFPVQEMPGAMYSLAPSCDLDQKLEQWKDGDISIKEVMESIQAKKSNSGC